jgi:hypothetical protein
MKSASKDHGGEAYYKACAEQSQIGVADDPQPPGPAQVSGRGLSVAGIRPPRPYAGCRRRDGGNKQAPPSAECSPKPIGEQLRRLPDCPDYQGHRQHIEHDASTNDQPTFGTLRHGAGIEQIAMSTIWAKPHVQAISGGQNA